MESSGWMLNLGSAQSTTRDGTGWGGIYRSVDAGYMEREGGERAFQLGWAAMALRYRGTLRHACVCLLSRVGAWANRGGEPSGVLGAFLRSWLGAMLLQAITPFTDAACVRRPCFLWLARFDVERNPGVRVRHDT